MLGVRIGFLANQKRGDKHLAGVAAAAMLALILEQDCFGLNHFTSAATWRPKRESCSIHGLESKIHVP
jgi:hypothetical protein